MINIPIHAKYSENEHKTGANKKGFMPCVVCGKAISKKSTSAKVVRVHNGGISLVTEEEALVMDEGADLGSYPLGADCLRRYPVLKPYVLGLWIDLNKVIE